MREQWPSPERRETKPLTLEAGFETAASERHPERNEDGFLVDTERNVFAVIDGIGGHAAGDRASQIVRGALSEFFARTSPASTSEEARQQLRQAFEEANLKIRDAISADSGLAGMGATASLVRFVRSEEGLRVVAGNLGDSRTWIRRANGALEQLSIDNVSASDDTEERNRLAELQSRLNQVREWSDFQNEQDMVEFDRRNVIRHGLGDHYDQPAIYETEFDDDDLVLLTSDGVHDNLTGDELSAITKKTAPPDELAQAIVEAARRRSREHVLRSKPDDMTAVIVRRITS